MFVRPNDERQYWRQHISDENSHVHRKGSVMKRNQSEAKSISEEQTADRCM